ncbi:hypothetical protein [Massilia phosphatilytica]
MAATPTQASSFRHRSLLAPPASAEVAEWLSTLPVSADQRGAGSSN